MIEISCAEEKVQTLSQPTFSIIKLFGSGYDSISPIITFVATYWLKNRRQLNLDKVWREVSHQSFHQQNHWSLCKSTYLTPSPHPLHDRKPSVLGQLAVLALPICQLTRFAIVTNRLSNTKIVIISTQQARGVTTNTSERIGPFYLKIQLENRVSKKYKTEESRYCRY